MIVPGGTAGIILAREATKRRCPPGPAFRGEVPSDILYGIPRIRCKPKRESHKGVGTLCASDGDGSLGGHIIRTISRRPVSTSRARTLSGPFRALGSLRRHSTSVRPTAPSPADIQLFVRCSSPAFFHGGAAGRDDPPERSSGCTECIPQHWLLRSQSGHGRPVPSSSTRPQECFAVQCSRFTIGYELAARNEQRTQSCGSAC